MFRPVRKHRSDAGIALLIAIFVLLLIAVVAIALVVSSGTESALAGNYRSSTGVYYAALAGVEEARARLRPNDPNSFKNTAPSLIPPPGTQWDIGYVDYILNPSPSDNLGTILATYPDTEYDTEFGAGALAAANGAGTVQTTPSVWNRNPLSSLPFSGPLYKWVRINAISEKSLNLDVDADGQADSTTPLYYDSTNPASPHFSNSPTAGSQALPQALELTALAVLPNSSQKLLQYLVTSVPLNLNLNAALTLDGNNVQFSVPTSTSFWIRGIDQGTAGTCNPGAAPVTAVGYTNGGDASLANILTAIGPPPAPDRRGNYMNGVAPTPNVGLVSVSSSLGCPGCSLTTVGGLNALVQAITNNADVVINGNATQSNMPGAMSATNPMTIVVNGDLTFTGWHNTGYGLLLVTGQFTYDPDASWDGIILVIGAGKIYSHQTGSGQFLGALFLARTLDASNNPLPGTSAPVAPFFDFTAASVSNGVSYSSCWVQASQPTNGYRILSFHELSQ